MTIYKEIILEHWRHPHNYGRFPSRPNFKQRQGRVSNHSCGDEIQLAVLMIKGKVKDAKFTGQGCAISMASSSLLTDYLKGKNARQLEKIDRKTIRKLLGVEISPARMKCALLSLGALKKILEK